MVHLWFRPPEARCWLLTTQQCPRHFRDGARCQRCTVSHAGWLRKLGLSCVRPSATPWAAACQAPLSSTISQSLLEFMSIELVIQFNHLILCHPLLLLPPIFPSIRVFSSELALCIRYPKYWSFNFRISPSNEYSGLISFRIDWFDLLAVQSTLKSLLQHQNSKASILQCSAFFMVQLSHLFVTTGWTAMGWTLINYKSPLWISVSYQNSNEG